MSLNEILIILKALSIFCLIIILPLIVLGAYIGARIDYKKGIRAERMDGWIPLNPPKFRSRYYFRMFKENPEKYLNKLFSYLDSNKNGEKFKHNI